MELGLLTPVVITVASHELSKQAGVFLTSAEQVRQVFETSILLLVHVYVRAQHCSQGRKSS
jgi:hypothetical protein